MHLTDQHGLLLQADGRPQFRRHQQPAIAIHVNFHRLAEEATLQLTHLRTGVSLGGQFAGGFHKFITWVKREAFVIGVTGKHKLAAAGFVQRSAITGRHGEPPLGIQIE